MTNQTEQQTVAPLPALQSGLFWLWISVLVIALDLITKFAVVDAMSLGESIQILPFFNFTYVHNYGAAFSFLSDAGGWQRWFFTAIGVGAVGLILYWLKQMPKNQKLQGVAFTLILGGAIGNLYDRNVYGYVVDFLHFYYQNWHFPAFNIADIAISCGAGLLIIEILFFSSEQDEAK